MKCRKIAVLSLISAAALLYCLSCKKPTETAAAQQPKHDKQQPEKIAANAPQRAYSKILKLYEPSEFNGMPYRLMKPIDFDPDKAYPLILSLHGAGGKGNKNLKNIKVWNRHLAKETLRRKHPCFVLVPQMNSGWRVNGDKEIPTQQDVDALPPEWNKWKERLRDAKPIENGRLSLSFELIEKLKGLYKIDARRIYVLGHSMGGFGSWTAIWHRPQMFAAAIPCAGGFPPWLDYARFRKVPIWAFHSADDSIVSAKHTQAIFSALRRIDSNMKYTEFKGYGHKAQVHAFTYEGDDASGLQTQYSSSRCDKTQDVWDWLFNQKTAATKKRAPSVQTIDWK